MTTDAPENTDTKPAGRGRGRPAGSTNKPKNATKTEVQGIIARTVLQVNVGVALASRFLLRHEVINGVEIVTPVIYQEDLLTAAEMEALADALTAEAMQSDRLRAMITTASHASPHIQLAVALFGIALPRMIRHGLLPASLLGGTGEQEQEQAPQSDDWRDVPSPAAMPMQAVS